MCSCVWFCLHTVESAFRFVFECVITTDCGILYCTDRVNGGGKKRGRAHGEWAAREKMNLFPPPPHLSSDELAVLLDDMLFGKPYPPLFAFLSSPWFE